jgi:hypothetical protein
LRSARNFTGFDVSFNLIRGLPISLHHDHILSLTFDSTNPPIVGSRRWGLRAGAPGSSRRRQSPRLDDEDLNVQ